MNERYGGMVIFNPYTCQEYSVEEIIDIIKYINGAYVPEDAADAKYINDLWIEFIVSIASDRYLVQDVNYKAINPGADDGVITEEDIANNENVLENLDLSILVMKDSYTYPFIKWFADKINAMYKTTSREETIAIYNEAYLAIIAMACGNGYVIDGVNYTLKDFDKDGMVLITEVLASQEMRNNMMEIGYTLDVENVGNVYIFLTDVLEETFNSIMCAEDLVDILIDGGVEVFEGVVEHGDETIMDISNYARVVQMNAFADALSNMEYGENYYQNKYLHQSEPGMVLKLD